VPRLGQPEAYIAAVAAELEMRRHDLTLPLRTCYVGGGTPTALPPGLLRQLLTMLSPMLADDAEFSIETNPATITEEVAQILAESGVSRVTLGAQSFQPAELEVLGRLHGPDDIARAAGLLREAGMDNLAVDLMYAIPGQSMASWSASLAAAVVLNPAHLSCYALSFEEETPLATDLRAGRVSEMDEERQRSMYYRAVETLTEAGYEHYELSNFARPAGKCRHNLVYWRNEPYLGIGPAACSFVDGRRWSTTRDMDAWLAAIDDTPRRLPPGEAEMLPPRAAMAEAMMLGLRMIDGIDEDAFAARYGARPDEAFPASISRHIELGMLERSGGRLRLAREALFISDAVLADIIYEGLNEDARAAK
jgi:oxygen-independent coproporphyrinogen-3 oxidase